MFVRHGPAADVMSSAGRDSSTAPTPPTPTGTEADQHRQRVVDDRFRGSPWYAARTRARSPASRWPMLPSSVENMISPDPE